MITRDLTYDGLRGWLLIVIACNHLYGSFVTQWTREPFGLVSAAEGFVFLSGFVAYLVYSKLVDQPQRLNQKVWRRCFTIYRFHLLGILVTFSLVSLFPVYIPLWSDFFAASNWFEQPLHSAIAATLLLEHPGFHDILILYLVPMLFLPLAIKLIKQGQAVVVAITSFSIWLIAQYISIDFITPLFNLLLPQIKLNVSYFDPLAWQIYFYLGVLLSHLKIDKACQFNFSPIIKALLLMAAALFFMLRHWPPVELESYLTGHGSAPLLRQINLLLMAYVLMLAMRKLPQLFTLRYPVFLGQHALSVFTFHAVVVYFLLPISQPYTTSVWYWDVVACLFFIALLAIPARLDQCFQQYRKKFTKNVLTI
ncbi:OpgC domain-containing protein [Psychrobium sp. 1_MG-2023]|uniref:OpgC domain-containing protein n=1 Tax=Psychrobium sp. 1_MG-2023 TaxID=3062624 RepID=UPI000C34F14E|nr:OpgC domain-containing protein [Psychrobium sp. 1_MG-2023]MDP2561613.1 OpgC domain-containing protein [Psychrobium sp. 1_MG-2023]PKF55632.1 hypothetical protein CW748_12290 [Alteromonadales bacterium alter-6D02]